MSTGGVSGGRINAYDASVIHQSATPTDSAGWTSGDFFKGLGASSNKVGSDQQQLEQVYLLSNMVKGAMISASSIASRLNIGIAVRGTNIRSHMGIESGDPTKAQEFKNKTANEKDLLLCDEMTFTDLGTVVHFDPRVGWTSRIGGFEAARRTQNSAVNGKLMPLTPIDWTRKRARLESTAVRDGKRGAFIPKSERDWNSVRSRFEQRVKEYIDEDSGYRAGGHYSAFSSIVGIHLRIKVSGAVSNRNMVGDHDLFGFTDSRSHVFKAPDTSTEDAQTRLQMSDAFQAQHGGIWYWNPPEDKNIAIKNVIMGAHGPDKDEPLVYFAGGKVMAMFYVKGAPDKLQSVWDFPGNKKWHPRMTV